MRKIILSNFDYVYSRRYISEDFQCTFLEFTNLQFTRFHFSVFLSIKSTLTHVNIAIISDIDCLWLQFSSVHISQKLDCAENENL